MIALLALLLWQGAPRQAPAAGGAVESAASRVQVGVMIAPDTVTVGDPFRVLVRVRAPRGATIEFPDGPDSAAAVQALDPRAVSPSADTGVVDQTASYRLVAWDVGELGLGMDAVVVRTGGVARVVPLASYRVMVRSVLPADSAARVPKPPRDILADAPPWWRWWMLALLALLLLALLAWWLWRRRRRRLAVQPDVDPYDLAEQEFDRIEKLGLLEAGERGRYVALVIEVLRDYLARRVPDAHPSLTSVELVAALRASPALPTDRLGAVLWEADLVKFARRPVTAERARELAREARAIVRDVNVALAPPPAADEPQKEAAA
jgi:hypothetical protein